MTDTQYGRSTEISGWAEPLLRLQALHAQSAQVDAVSGDGYRTALASARASAKM